MAFIVGEDGNITLVQGDTGELNISGIKTDQNYTIYFAMQDENRKPIGQEIYMSSAGSDKVTLVITSDRTDLLTVPTDEDYATYYYGLKACGEDGSEDTFLIGDSKLGDVNTITVYPKKVEGV